MILWNLGYYIIGEFIPLTMILLLLQSGKKHNKKRRVKAKITPKNNINFSKQLSYKFSSRVSSIRRSFPTRFNSRLFDTGV